MCVIRLRKWLGRNVSVVGVGVWVGVVGLRLWLSVFVVGTWAYVFQLIRGKQRGIRRADGEKRWYLRGFQRGGCVNEKGGCDSTEERSHKILEHCEEIKDV